MTDELLEQHEKNRVAMTSLLAAIGITAVKIVVGVMTHSLGILAEAAHSGLDLVAAAMTCWAVRAAGRPADPSHHFGHGKFENLSALFEALLLIITCIWIVWGAIGRLFYKSVEVDANVWSFAVMVASVAVDWSRSRALKRAAKKYNSQALEADALHFETDIWSSLAVIVGLACVAVGHRVPALSALRHGDAIAALGVAIIAGSVTVRLTLRTLTSLSDAAPPGLAEKVRAAVLSIPGVIDCHQIRVRESGPEIFIDAHMTADSNKTLGEVHAMADRAEDAVRQAIPGADVTLHAEPGENAETPK